MKPSFSMMLTYLLLPLAFLITRPAHAQCTKDTDCKGDRICQQGQCVSPSAVRSSAPLAPAAAPFGQTAPQSGHAPHQQGWGRGAAILGFAAGGVALAFAGGAEMQTGGDGDTATGIALGSVAMATLLVTSPIIAAGGASERASTGATGLPGLRVAAWMLYGLVAADGLGLIALAAADVGIPHGPAIAAGLAGTASLVMFATDALVSKSEAQGAQLTSGAGSSMSIAPFVGPARLLDGKSVGLLGVSGSF